MSQNQSVTFAEAIHAQNPFTEAVHSLHIHSLFVRMLSLFLGFGGAVRQVRKQYICQRARIYKVGRFNRGFEVFTSLGVVSVSS
jgi:hypothetical protein